VHAVAETTKALIERALSAPLGPPDKVHCNSEQIDPATVHFATLPDVHSYQVSSVQEGRLAATQLLVSAGLAETFAEHAVAALVEGAGPDGAVMRGAVLMDALTGERLEYDPARGVRVSRMDLLSTCRSDVETLLANAGLDHHRILEALILSGKVMLAPGVVAELCWSDAPDYVTGYVAAPQCGYQRISQLKAVGERHGGRVFFVDRSKVTVSDLVDYLERQPVLFDAAGTIAPMKKWEMEDA
jgi:6-carboxyhexanoate--CoA ligase